MARSNGATYKTDEKKKILKAVKQKHHVSHKKWLNSHTKKLADRDNGTEPFIFSGKNVNM